MSDTCYWKEDRKLEIPKDVGKFTVSSRPDQEILDKVRDEELQDIIASIQAEMKIKKEAEKKAEEEKERQEKLAEEKRLKEEAEAAEA